MMPGVASSAPVCLLMATSGTTRPSAAGCRRSELHVTVVDDGDAGECRHGFALRSGRQAQDVLAWIARDFRVPNLQAGRYLQMPEPLGNLRVLDHAAADKGDFAFELRRQID